MLKALITVGLILHIGPTIETEDDKKLNEIIAKSVQILSDNMSESESEFLKQMLPSCTVQWLKLKKKKILSGIEYDELCNDPVFWSHVNKRYKIVHHEDFFFTVVCVAYYYKLNEKTWDLTMCFDHAAALEEILKKTVSSNRAVKTSR